MRSSSSAGTAHRSLDDGHLLFFMPSAILGCTARLVIDEGQLANADERKLVDRLVDEN
jgi:hypothetical protein